MEKFEAKIECQACGGTGLYVGLSERDGAAVVCHRCKGTGEYHYTFSYTPFSERIKRSDVKRVYKSSCGYVHTVNDTVLKDSDKLIKFSEGGCSYEDWLSGKEPVPLKELYCPMQWTGQKWKSPIYCKDNYFGGYISECPKRCDMDKCWEIYEQETQNK